MRIGDARPTERGITLFELLMVCGIIGLLAAIAIPIYQHAMEKARRVALAGNFTELYSAFMRYHVDYGHFPSDTGAGSFETATLAPLSTSGYFPHAQTINDALENHEAFFYWAPDWEGPDSDFIIAGRSATNPDVLVYAMHYDFEGAFAYDGVYLVIDGVLVRADGEIVTVAASLERVQGVVDTLLGETPPTLLELKRRLAGELAIEPKAEILQALSALAEMSDPGARAVAKRAAVLHLVLESAYSELWERPEADPAALDRALAALPALLDLARREGSEVASAVDRVDRMQRDAVAKIHAALQRPEDPLIAALSVVPELTRLVLASRAGRLEEDAPFLHAEEVALLAASSQADAAARPERALVDSVALRSAIERAVAEAAAPPALAELRSAHTVVSHRLDALRARQFEKTRRGDPLLDAARRRLFTTYLALSKALAGEAVEPTSDVRESILAAEREGAAIDAEKAQAADAIKSAADGAAEAPREAVVAPDARDLVSERRRKRVLTSLVAALVPIAVGVNVWLLPRGRGATLVELKPLNVAMPVSEAMPIGGVLYSKIATFLWDGMGDAERTRRLTDLGRIAGLQGYQSVVVVDDTRTERAYWTASGGVMLRAPETQARP